MADTIDESIEERAISGVKSISVDGVQTEYVSIDEQLKAARRTAAQAGADQNHRGLRFTKLTRSQ